MLDMGNSYWMMTTHIILFITQLLSMLGIAGEINMMAWMYINLANMVVGMLMGLAYLYSYNVYWDLVEDTSNSTAIRTDAAAAMGYMELRKNVNMVFGSHYMFALYKNHKNWMMAQWMGLPEETQMAMKESMHKEGDMDEDDMYTLFGF